MITNSFSVYGKKLTSRMRIDPIRDWLMLVMFSGIALAVIIVWNIWAFDTVASGGVIGSPSTTTPPFFSQSSINTIHTIFENRANEEAKYQTGTYRFADPSR